MSDPFIGQIIMFGGNFAPRGWALCNGQLLAISQNTALFSILGTTYGGDGQTSFGLPDLRGRFPLHAGNGPGLTQRVLGSKSGTEQVTMTTSQMPAHSHTGILRGASGPGTTNSPAGAVPAGTNEDIYAATADANMGAVTIGNTGGGQSQTNMPPFQVINFIIALQGTFPSRN